MKKFLLKKLKELDEIEAIWHNVDSPWDTVQYIVEQITLRAGKLGLPDLVEAARGKNSLHDARVYIAQCLQATKGTDYLSVTEAARLMQVNRDNVLSWINTGRLKATNTSKGIRPRYRIARADLEAMGRTKETRKKIRKSKSNIPDYFPQY